MYKEIFRAVKQVNQKKMLFFLTILTILASTTKIFIGYLYSPLIDSYSENRMKITLWYFLLLVCLYFFNWLMGKKIYYSGEILKKYEEYYIIKKIIRNFHYSELKKLNIDNVGTWQTYLSSDVTNISSYATDSFIPLVRGVITFLGAVIIGINLSITLTLSILILSFLAVYIPKIGGKYIVVNKNEEQIKNEEFQAAFLQIVKEKKMIRINNICDFAISYFDNNLKKYNSSIFSTKRLSALLVSTSITSGFLFTVLWLSIGLYLILIKEITFGNFVTFIILNDSFIWIFFEFPIIVSDFLEKKVSIQRIENLSEEYDNPEISEGVTNFKSLELKNIYYNYLENKDSVLKGVDFLIKENCKNAIVGQSGSGKSTLIDIILGYNKIKNGQLLLNGTDNFKLEELQRIFSYMPQKNIIFRGTIKENIFFDCEPSKEEINTIISVSGVKEIVQKNHFNMETIIDPFNGSYINLSEGEKQRIGFARLLAKKSSVLILDEPTAFLDKNNENRILEYIKKTKKSVILITHRSENIPINYEILLLKDGRLEKIV